jgi:CheY-like chemotaxis protein
LAEISVAIASGRPYSLVIVDGGMPEMDGFEAIAEIRKIAADLPVVLLTSDINSSDAARHRQAGFLGYAVKPVTRAELLHLVCDAMKAPENREPQPFTERGPDERIEPANPMKILVAEDSADNRLLIQAYMKGSPHTLTFVETERLQLISLPQRISASS